LRLVRHFLCAKFDLITKTEFHISKYGERLFFYAARKKNIFMKTQSGAKIRPYWPQNLCFRAFVGI